jgi:hypothetical protein
VDDLEQRRWNDDLDVLAREMPALHANLFHMMSHQRFDEAIAELRRRLPTLDQHQVVVELMRLAAAVGDGHTGVMPWRQPAGFHTLPVSLYHFAEGYHVRAARRDHMSLLGGRVSRVGGVPIEEAQRLLATLIGRDNEQGIPMYAPLLMVMPEVLHALGLSDDPRHAELTIDDDAVMLDSAGPFPLLSDSAPAESLWGPRDGWVDLRDSTPEWLSRLSETYWFSYLPEGRLLYCQLNAVREREEPFDAFFARMLAAADAEGARRLVLDLRHNNGGDGDYVPAIVRPLLRSRFDERGGLYVITSRRTFSAAQMLICELEKWTFPIFVGEPAASRGNHFGDSEDLVLPHHRITVRVSSLWWQLWDPRETRPWIEVDLPAPLTVEAYRDGRDPALEAITGLQTDR